MTALILALSGCDKKQAESEGHEHEHDRAAEESGSGYQEGRGLLLSEETAKSLGLEFVQVEEKAVDGTYKITAQIYRSASENSRAYGPERQGNAYATALVAKDLAEQLRVRQKLILSPKDGSREGVIWKIDPAQTVILGQAEILLEIPDSGGLAVGDFVEAELPVGPTGKKVITIPRSAVLETSTGRFAFVKNAPYLLRAEIKTGVQDRDHLEVTDGLHEGDTIVVKPVEALHLIELRATKGGGHSH